MFSWSTGEWVLLLTGMSLGTLASRLSPILVLGKKKLPAGGQQLLRYVPSAVLAAAIAPALFLRSGEFHPLLSNHYLLAAVPTFLVGFFSKNLFLAVLVGMAAITLIRFV